MIQMMLKQYYLNFVLILILLVFSIELTSAQEKNSGVQDKNSKRTEMLDKFLKRFKGLSFYGDFRFRTEQDWNSKQSSSSSNNNTGMRNDRTRLRYRLRFGFKFNWNEQIQFGTRLRTGVPTNLQSPHINFGYKGFGMVPFMLDKLYVQGKYKNAWWWIGKNGFPFWKQNELFWDDDVTPEGLVIGGKFGSGNIGFKPTFGYFLANSIPVSQTGTQYSVSGAGYGNGDNAGEILGIQLKLEFKGDNADTNIGVSLYEMSNIFVNPELNPSFISEGIAPNRNYRFFMLSLQQKLMKGASWPITIGVDYVNNLQDYKDESNVSDHLKDQKTSYTISLSAGKKKKKGDWYFAYYYAHKEMFSVVSYYAEDDWVRWGNIHANRNTNFSGHELRAIYTVGKNMNVVARYYNVNAIKKRKTSDDQLESGNRFRIDLNIKF